MAKAKTTTAAAPEQVIYLGPTMLEREAGGQTTFVINYGTIYKNGLPDDVAARMEADADFKRLFVPVAGAAKAMQELAKDTPLSSAKARVGKAYAARQKGGKK